MENRLRDLERAMAQSQTDERLRQAYLDLNRRAGNTRRLGEHELLLDQYQALERLAESYKARVDSLAGRIESWYGNVQDLILAGTQVTDQGLEHIATLPLTKLDLRYNQITDQGLTHLPKTLTELGLMETHITDQGLPHLPKTLITLDLGFCRQITDQGLENLPPTLTKLWLLNTSVTERGTAALEKRIPGIKIY